MSAHAISRRRYDLTVPIEISPGKRWWLYARSSRLGGSILGGLGDILLVVALGTLFLVTVLYGLLDRLILSPLGDVVHAAQQIERGGQPAKLRGEERFDEMGTLLKSFNRMAREVRDSRKNLEHRVEQAVSGYRRAQSQLAVAQRLSATGKLAAGIAHEINNPLGGMVNAARSVRESLDDGTREAEYAELILDGLDRIARTVQGMLQFSRERLPGEVSRVAIAEVVAAAKGFCTHRIDGEGVELDVDIPDDVPEITGGPGELQQVVLNLLVNAIDAVGASETKRITISARADGDSVELSVADTGCGMDDDTREQAFDIFFTTKDPEAGTGLGLSVAHQIVDDHGGRMEIDSTPGEGTTVKVRLPAAQGAGPERVEGGAGETA